MENFRGVDDFMKKYQLEHCDSAKKLIKKGKSNYVGEETEQGLAARVMDITSKMINAIDLLQLECDDVHQVCVAVVDIQNALAKYPNISQQDECVIKIGQWASILKEKQATDQISENELKQLKMDLETSYQSFHKILNNQ